MSIIYENIEFDPNILFNFSYNYDNLKLLLEKFQKNQKMIINRLNELDNISNIEPNKKNEIDKLNTENNVEKNVENINQLNQDIMKHTVIQSGVTEISNINSANNNEDLESRIKIIEKKLNKLLTFIPKCPEDKSQTLLNILGDHHNLLSNLSNENNDLKNKYKKLNDEFEEIKVKVNDFNIYDIFKTNGNDSNNSSNLDVNKVLIQNLETKIFKKIGFQDERIKSSEETIIKSSNEIQNLKNNLEQQIRNFNNFKENYENFFKEDENFKNKQKELNKKFINDINLINKELKDKLNNLIKDFNDYKQSTDSYLKEDFNKDLIKSNANNPSEEKVSNKELKKLKDYLTKKINELEKEILTLSEKTNLSPIKEDIQSIKSSLYNKINSTEFYELHEQFLKISNSFDNLKDREDMDSDEIRKIKDDLRNMGKKYEQIMQNIYRLTKPEQSNDKLINKLINERLENYVQLNTFNDFCKDINKDNERIRRELDAFKQNVYDLQDEVKDKATEKELKSLEEYLITLLDENKTLSSKLYANRIDTNKNFKTLEINIKHILEEFNTKMNKENDSWILAKRPVNGYTCASCEAYLGDLKDRTSENWTNHNPLSLKDYEKFDKTNKIGNGFSRILNLINLKIENKKEKEDSNIFINNNNNTSNKDFCETEDNKGTAIKKKQFVNTMQESSTKDPINSTKQTLPPINKTEDNILYQSIDNNTIINENGPKVTRIYRKNKNIPKS